MYQITSAYIVSIVRHGRSPRFFHPIHFCPVPIVFTDGQQDFYGTSPYRPTTFYLVLFLPGLLSIFFLGDLPPCSYRFYITILEFPQNCQSSLLLFNSDTPFSSIGPFIFSKNFLFHLFFLVVRVHICDSWAELEITDKLFFRFVNISSFLITLIHFVMQSRLYFLLL